MWVLAAVFFLLAGCSCREDDGLEEIPVREEEVSPEESRTEAEDTRGKEISSESGKSAAGDAESAETVFVYVCGAVNAPGVYEMDPGGRVFEAVRLAGGVTEEAAPELINQARTVSDGERIYVPNRGEAEAYGNSAGMPEGEMAGAADGSVGKKININTAGKDELMELNGIGESKAESILRYREEHGRFRSIEELMQIEGIKEGVFNKIKDDITT